ncbi:hypothetical protein Marky_1737 [Marinithermus hydrothermalis DSM 14884]|uniref:Uncharacterized protein n=2 Tax=Marinithermus TaxID=186191 RepID=F2NMT8_MARHT|nr:hypothetical protein Marky_1737 [Marinithermus hydrothermalis DSM 14884]
MPHESTPPPTELDRALAEAERLIARIQQHPRWRTPAPTLEARQNRFYAKLRATHAVAESRARLARLAEGFELGACSAEEAVRASYVILSHLARLWLELEQPTPKTTEAERP